MLKPKKIQFDKFWTQIEQTNYREIVALIDSQDLLDFRNTAQISGQNNQDFNT